MKNNFIIYFGGTYNEYWENGRLIVKYTERELYSVKKDNSKWIPDHNLPVNPLSDEYFTGACDVANARDICETMQVDHSRICEIFHSDSRIAPFELFRMLLDEWAYKIDDAVDTVARCCNIIDFSDDYSDLIALQPRTHYLIPILKKRLSIGIYIYHNSKYEEFRSPIGAIKTDDSVKLRLFDVADTVSAANCILYYDNGEKFYHMTRSGNTFFVTIPMDFGPKAAWYVFQIETKTGIRWINADKTGFNSELSLVKGEGFRLTVYDKHFTTPDWFKKSIMYQIFPDRFARSDDDTAQKGLEYHKALGQTPQMHNNWDDSVKWQPLPGQKFYEPDDFYGGTLKGIISRLDYLENLGISVIYLNPIVEAKSNHRYDTSDYLKVDPILGSVEDFKLLCAEAEKRGIRIINDGVFSHTGADSIYFNKYGNYNSVGAWQGNKSKYYNWYTFENFNSGYKCWWNFPELPEVNESHPDWQEYIINGKNSVVKSWLRWGSSGWRLDVADEIPDEELSMIRSAAKEEKADALILGEVWEDAVLKESYGSRRNYALGYSLDTVMNYPFRSAILSFIHFDTTAYDLRDFLYTQKLNYPEPMYYSLMNLLGSHDVERLRTNIAFEYDVNKLARGGQAVLFIQPEKIERISQIERICATIQFSIPGVPSIYYGDEVGMDGCRDPFNRTTFKEGPNSPLEFYKTLCSIRNSSKAFSIGSAEFSAFGNDVLIIKRTYKDDEYTIIVNRSDESRYVEIAKGGANMLSGKYIPDNFLMAPLSQCIIHTEK